MTQDDLAVQADLNRSYPYRVEQGKVDIHLSTLRRIAAALGVSVTDLLDPKD